MFVGWLVGLFVLIVLFLHVVVFLRQRAESEKELQELKQKQEQLETQRAAQLQKEGLEWSFPKGYGGPVHAMPSRAKSIRAMPGFAVPCRVRSVP